MREGGGGGVEKEIDREEEGTFGKEREIQESERERGIERERIIGKERNGERIAVKDSFGERPRGRGVTSVIAGLSSALPRPSGECSLAA